MRASDIIDAPVLGDEGDRVGVVIDLRCRQDGPLRGAMHAPRVHALIVSRHQFGSLLGYERRRQGPWIVRVIVRALHRHAFQVDWDEIEFDGHTVRLRANATRRALADD